LRLLRGRGLGRLGRRGGGAWLGEEEVGVLVKGEEAREGEVEGVYEGLGRRVEGMKMGDGD
jgi:hypothetical protein